MEKWKEMRGSAISLTVSLAGVASVCKECLLELGVGIKLYIGREWLGGKICKVHWTWEQRGKGGCSRYSIVELGMRLGDLIWRSRERGEGLKLAYLLSWLELTSFFIRCFVSELLG